MRNALARLLCVLSIVAAQASCGRSEPREPDLPEEPDRWVSSIELNVDSKIKFIGRTKDYVVTSVSTVEDVNGPTTISVGDKIEQLPVGAIKCSFFWRDASSGGEQYMWRGRWGCQAGRNRQEVEKAVGSDGEKRYDYIYVSPVQLGSD